MDATSNNSSPFTNCSAAVFMNCANMLPEPLLPSNDTNTENGTTLDIDTETEFMELTIAKYILKTVLPFLLVFGTFGNVTAFVVLIQMCRKGSTVFVYLAVLACVDLMALYVFSLRQWVLHVFEVDIWCYSCWSCRLAGVMTQFTDQMSAWIQVTFTLVRVLAVSCPLRFRSHCSMKSNVIILTTIGLVLFAHNSHILIWMKRNPDMMDITSCLPGNDVYAEFYYDVWPWINVTISSILPTCILIVGSALIIHRVRRSQHQSGLGRGSVDTEAPSSQQERRIKAKNDSLTEILFAVNVTFLLCTLPICVFGIGYGYWLKNADDHRKSILKLVWTGCNILSCTNHAVNFLLYSLSGRQFRLELRSTLGCIKRLCRIR
jgi:hypothetical protein